MDYRFNASEWVNLSPGERVNPSAIAALCPPSGADWKCAQRDLGLDGVVSHAVDFEIGTRLRAQRIDYWSKRIWNRLGQGDYMFVVMAEDEHG